MEQSERLEWCKVCRYRHFDIRKGMVCSLTGEPASFQDVCEPFDQDDVQLSRERNNQEAQKDDSYETEIKCGFVVLFMIWYIAFALGQDAENQYRIPLIATIITISIFLIIFGMSKIINYFKNLNKQLKSISRPLSLDDITNCLRHHGQFPIKTSDTSLLFKISDQRFDIILEGRKLTLRTGFLVPKDIINPVLYAANSVMDELVMIKIYCSKAEDDDCSLSFEVNSYEMNAEGIEDKFDFYMNVILTGINRHKEIYNNAVSPDSEPEEVTPEEVVDSIAGSHRNPAGIVS